MKRLLYTIIILLLPSISAIAAAQDSIPDGLRRPLSWRFGAEVNPALIPGTNRFLKGDNRESRAISSGLSGDLRSDFSFATDSREGILYKGLYQGIGIGVNSFFAGTLLGTPISAYVYQGAPIVRISERLELGYEWRFGASFGWRHYDEINADDNSAVSTSVTAMLGVGFKFQYTLSERWRLSLGINGTHYSNGNTSWPNAGVNAIGATAGIAYVLNPKHGSDRDASGLIAEADRGCWTYDIVAYVAYRRKAVDVGDEPQLCPGKFGVAGVLFSPLRKLNRYVAVGPSLDLQWDESAGLEPYWIEGTTGKDIQFERPPFGKQLSVGLSAHAELTMPIFTINAGIGYSLISPKGEKRFYQSLTLKTFLSRNLFLNIGYRIGDFKEPQNLMLGLGVRL